MSADAGGAYGGVICLGDLVDEMTPCGKVDISEAEYLRQMARPNRGWSCPQCGSSANFDDARYEHLQGISS